MQNNCSARWNIRCGEQTIIKCMKSKCVETICYDQIFSCYCTVWWHVAGKISRICPFDSRARAVCQRRCSAVCLLCDGEGADHCPWWITVCSAFSSPPRSQKTPTWDQVQSQPSWWFYQVCSCHWLWSCWPNTQQQRNGTGNNRLVKDLQHHLPSDP